MYCRGCESFFLAEVDSIIIRHVTHPLILCQGCGEKVAVRHGEVEWHAGPRSLTRCPGSGKPMASRI